MKNAQGCQLGTLQILILHGLMISNQSKTIVGPLTHGYLKLLPDYYFAWCVVNSSVKTNRQMASQYFYLPWICLAGGLLADDRYSYRAEEWYRVALYLDS